MAKTGDAGVTVFGCGEPLRGDDGLGHRALERLPHCVSCLANVRPVRSLDPEDLAELPRGTFVVIVDAVAGVPPGRLVRIDLARLGEAVGAVSPTSTHQLPLGDVIGFAELLGWNPRGVFLGVGAATVAPGEGLSPEVERALPELGAAIVEEVLGARTTHAQPGAAGTVSG
jgi:hydrogenase maturation protease